MRKTILACVIVALIVGSTSATAATLITSADIQNGTIQATDIKKGAISENRLSDGVRDLLRDEGKVGPAGKDGATVYGPKGDAGPQGPQGERGGPGRDGVGLQGAQGAQGDPARPAPPARRVIRANVALPGPTRRPVRKAPMASGERRATRATKARTAWTRTSPAWSSPPASTA